MNITNVTPLISITSGAYPLYLPQVRAADTTKSFAEFPSEDVLAQLGYAVVHPTLPPVGNVVTEDSPGFRNDRWEQQWLVRDFTTEEKAQKFAALQATHLEQIKLLQVATEERGFLYTFPDNSQGRVQLRSGDRANMNAIRTRAESLKAAGRSDPQYFRTFENETKGPLSPDQAIVLSDTAYDKYMQMLQLCWALKAQTESAQTTSMFPAIPPNFDDAGI